MLSQEKAEARRREARSTAGEMMLERKRVWEEVRVSTREMKDKIISDNVIPSLRMFLEHQGTGLAGRL